VLKDLHYSGANRTLAHSDPTGFSIVCLLLINSRCLMKCSLTCSLDTLINFALSTQVHGRLSRMPASSGEGTEYNI
jgi:hypothetical protein